MFGCGNRAATLPANPAENDSESPHPSKRSRLLSWTYFVVCSAALLIAGAGPPQRRVERVRNTRRNRTCRKASRLI